MQIVSNGQNLHEMSNLDFWEKEEKWCLLNLPREWFKLIVYSVLLIYLYHKMFYRISFYNFICVILCNFLMVMK